VLTEQGEANCSVTRAKNQPAFYTVEVSCQQQNSFIKTILAELGAVFSLIDEFSTVRFGPGVQKARDAGAGNATVPVIPCPSVMT
jgi:hypothetical protein